MPWPEHTIALLMELARQVGKLDRQVKTGDWDGADGYELYGKKLGIIGLGGIGQTVARIAGALGMNVSAWNSHVPEQVSPIEYHSSQRYERADCRFRRGLHPYAAAGLHKRHRHCGKPRSSETGNHVYQHGPCGNHRTGALLARLQRGDIPAALDVFEHEPLTADDPLCSIPGIILTPHTAWRTDGAYVGITRQVVQSVAAFCKGEDFNVVV